jgi:hypothetical protein
MSSSAFFLHILAIFIHRRSTGLIKHPEIFKSLF